MAMKAKHAFGALERVDENIQSGVIDSYDILFVKDSDGKPYVGWISKDGQKEIVDPYTEVAKLETQVETELATKANASEVEALEKRVNAEFKKNAAQMYEIAKAPEGTLVDYFDKEIRIMIPKATDFANLNNGIAGVENMRYVECRIYAPEGAVRYKSDLGGMVMAGKVEDFAGFTDERGKVYIITFPSIAYYDTESAAWVYYGANSTTKRYEGWNHTIEWFDENGVAIASDSVKINLSNEDCHYAVEPYYVGEMMAKVETIVDTLVDEKIAEINTGYEIIEF